MLNLFAVIVISVLGVTGPIESDSPGNTLPAQNNDSQNGAPPLTFFAGRYQAIGRHPDTQSSYLGDVTISIEDETLTMTRDIGGTTIPCRGKWEKATADRVPVLKFSFRNEGVDYGITYLWQVDLDNYARLTGYLYRMDGKTLVPGLEALFIKH